MTFVTPEGIEKVPDELNTCILVKPAGTHPTVPELSVLPSTELEGTIPVSTPFTVAIMLEGKNCKLPNPSKPLMISPSFFTWELVLPVTPTLIGAGTLQFGGVQLVPAG
jgi:hypothetical protein